MQAPRLTHCVTLDKLLSLSEHQTFHLQNGKGLKGTVPGGVGGRLKCDAVCEGLRLPPGANASGESVRPVGVGASRPRRRAGAGKAETSSPSLGQDPGLVSEALGTRGHCDKARTVPGHRVLGRTQDQSLEAQGLSRAEHTCFLS